MGQSRSSLTAWSHPELRAPHMALNMYTRFDPQNPEHEARRHMVFIDDAGDLSIPDQFASILLKVNKSSNSFIRHADIFLQGTQVSELQEFRNSSLVP
jgi:hypothetical protein